MKIENILILGNEKIAEHFIPLFIKSNGPSTEEEIELALKEIFKFIGGAVLLELISEKKVGILVKRKTRKVCFKTL